MKPLDTAEIDIFISKFTALLARRKNIKEALRNGEKGKFPFNFFAKISFYSSSDSSFRSFLGNGKSRIGET